MILIDTNVLLRSAQPEHPHLFRDERAIFDRWRQLVEQHEVQGKSGHDTRLVAAMNRHRLSYLLTFNHSDFKRFKEITAVHPDNFASLSPQ
jgi:predicted nucleic acid-binding protein